MFAIKTESIKSYVEAPKSLLKEHRNLLSDRQGFVYRADRQRQKAN